MRKPVALAAVVLVAAIAAADLAASRRARPSAFVTPRFDAPAAKGGSAVEQAEACRRCHPSEVAAWGGSQHAAALTAFDPARDAAPPGVTGPVVAWIGVRPLRQALLAAPGGRLQVHDPAVDVRTGEAFSIHGADAPRPDEWGHATQRGMTWNAQCAACHTTGLAKAWDPERDTYATSWEAIGVGCAACHGPQPGHAVDPKAGAAGAGAIRARAVFVCWACHARREDLTHAFAPGEDFDDHFRLLVADVPGLHHADGRARDEVFEAGPLLLSRMGRAGVTCLDCHDPHAGRLRAPIDDDALCLGCHRPPGVRGATPIDAATHSRHDPAKEGARCVACHMPKATYMARDERRDHAFASPDPALAQEIGAPDPCTGCHADRGVTWAVARAQELYGDRLDRPARRRARAMARAWRGDAGAAPELVAIARATDAPAWRASILGAIAPFADDAAVRRAIMDALDDPAPLVRAAAVRALARFPEARARLRDRRRDPSRVVRLAASFATRATVREDAAARAELARYLDLGADQPGGAIRAAELAIAEQRPSAAVTHARRAVAWDPSAPSWGSLARALAAAGDEAGARDAIGRAAAADRAAR